MAKTQSNIKTTEDESREFLINLGIERWGNESNTDFDSLSLHELEAFAEYGDKNAFWEEKFDESRPFYGDNQGRRSTGTAVLNDHKYQNWQDKSIAMRLGGFSMRRNVAISQKGDITNVEKRKKTIKEIIAFLPLKYKNIGKIIIDNDLNKLAELCKDYYTPTIRKILGPLILKRAHEHGLFLQIKEITKDLQINRAKFLSYQKILEDEGFFDSSAKESTHEALMNATSNVIWQLAAADLVPQESVQTIRLEVKSIIEKHSKIWLTRDKLDKVLVLVALRHLNPEIRSKDLAIFLSDTKREAADLFKRVKSASNRAN